MSQCPKDRPHRCGLCTHPYRTYARAEACARAHLAQFPSEEVRDLLRKRRTTIDEAVRTGRPVWLTWAAVSANWVVLQ